MIPQERQKIRHLLIVKDRRGKRVIPLTQDIYTLGRAPDNDIVLYGSSVSRQHATIARQLNHAKQLTPFVIINGNLEGELSTNGISINHKKSDRHILRHGDFIEFGFGVKVNYYTLFNLTDREFTEYCETKANFQSLERSASASFPVTTSESTPESVKTTNEGDRTSLGLASFTELTPHPIIEIDLSGAIKYLNPEAIKRFPQLQSLGRLHPLIAGLPTSSEQYPLRSAQAEGSLAECDSASCEPRPPSKGGVGSSHLTDDTSTRVERGCHVLTDRTSPALEGRGRLLTREIEFQQQFFEQSIQYFHSDGIIRILMTEITERKQKYLLQEQSARLLRIIVAHNSFEAKIQSILKIGCSFFDLDCGFLGKLQNRALQITTIHNRQDYCYLEEDSVLEISAKAEDRSLRLFQLTSDRKDYITLQKLKQLEKENSLTWNDSLPKKSIPITSYLGIGLIVGKKTYGIVAFFSSNKKLREFSPIQIQFLKLIVRCLEKAIEQRQIELVVKKLLKQKNYSQQIAAEIRQPINELVEIVQQLTHSNLDYSQNSLAQALHNRSENLLDLIQHLLAK